ncbi:glycoside hydrolase family 2 TIM barrel-domain containing protein [Adhaeribacter aquaticus]|uniref:glycoside hydrolase family 2 TIM barrel-domain containing protein n=1 Tax=Adhaeribacter aquaticus TaxID=299567 RepID=UPI0004134155|nr:glycoside hydrolase family 2 TIM barrel-domain containing protein [Adhaeribacter aquaticus]
MKNRFAGNIWLLGLLPLLQAFTSNSGSRIQKPSQPIFINQINSRQIKPIKVEVKKGTEGYQLIRNGKPYFIKGAGGTNYMDRVAAYGGNSIRTWSTANAQEILDQAQRLGLTVTMGLNVRKERHGFDYNNSDAVTKQLQELREEVLKFKDHPALLMWGIGNELNLSYTNPKVWDAVNNIAKMIHEVDPNHPATTMLAGANKKEIDRIKAQSPELDLLSFQTYGGLGKLPGTLENAGWTGPYVVTEWGPVGHWEGPQTPWKASVEETSSEKAAGYKSRYEEAVLQDKTRCLGSYVFLWGQKQERTPTWYGVFTEKGEETEVVDVIQYLWSGKWPQNKAPRLDSFLLDGKKSTNQIYVKAGGDYIADARVKDPEKEKLTYRWELLPEGTNFGEGGDREDRPQPIPGQVTTGAGGRATLKAPAKEGPYRLFVYAADGHNNVATANIPFFVQK